MKRYDIVSTTVDGVTTSTVNAQTTDTGYLNAAAAAFTSLTAIWSADGEKTLVTQKEQGISSLTAMGVGFLGGDWYGHRAAAKGGRSFISRVVG